MPRYTSPDGTDVKETSVPVEGTNLKAMGYRESAALTNAVRESDGRAPRHKKREEPSNPEPSGPGTDQPSSPPTPPQGGDNDVPDATPSA